MRFGLRRMGEVYELVRSQGKFDNTRQGWPLDVLVYKSKASQFIFNCASYIYIYKYVFGWQFRAGGEAHKGPVVTAQEAQAQAILSQARVSADDYFHP